MDELSRAIAPDCVVKQAEVLEINVDLVDGKIPYNVLDQIVDVHGIDVTGLQMSQTPNGTLYRTYRLLPK